MMHSPVEIELATAGSVIQDTLHASLIIIQMQVRAIDVDRDLAGKNGKPDLMPDLADQIRLAGKSGDKRIAYIIFNGKIASPRKAWRWRPYDGINKHNHHAHISFTTKGDEDSTWFNIPMIGGN